MKKNYEKPNVEVMDFKLDDVIMTGESGGLDNPLSTEEGFEPSPF